MIPENSISAQLARHLLEVHFGENWTWSNLKDQLKVVDFRQATTSAGGCNTIALLVFHMNYYLNAVRDRIEGKSQQAKHELSLLAPPIQKEGDWHALLEKTWLDAGAFARLIEDLPEQRLWENISEKHGTVYRNIQGVIEHNHYHLGQIVILKKIIQSGLFR